MNEQRQRQPAQHHLRQPEPENILAQPPQAARMKLQPDQEQQQRDADFGDARQILGIVEPAQQLRPDQRPADDIAKRRAKPQPPENGDEQQRRPKHHRPALKQRASRLRGGRPRRSSRVLDRRKQGHKRQQDRPMPPPPRPRRRKHVYSGPSSPHRHRSSHRSIPAIASRSSASLSPTAPAPISAAEACPKAQASTLCDSAATRPSAIRTPTETLLPQVGDRFSAYPSTSSMGSRYGIDAARRKYVARIERRGHARRQTVPAGPSSSSTPSAANSSRIAIRLGKVAPSLGLAPRGDPTVDVVATTAAEPLVGAHRQQARATAPKP